MAKKIISGSNVGPPLPPKKFFFLNVSNSPSKFTEKAPPPHSLEWLCNL